MTSESRYFSGTGGELRSPWHTYKIGDFGAKWDPPAECSIGIDSGRRSHYGPRLTIRCEECPIPRDGLSVTGWWDGDAAIKEGRVTHSGGATLHREPNGRTTITVLLRED